MLVCSDHPEYRGKKKPTTNCKICDAIHTYQSRQHESAIRLLREANELLMEFYQGEFDAHSWDQTESLLDQIYEFLEDIKNGKD